MSRAPRTPDRYPGCWPEALRPLFIDAFEAWADDDNARAARLAAALAGEAGARGSAELVVGARLLEARAARDDKDLRGIRARIEALVPATRDPDLRAAALRSLAILYYRAGDARKGDECATRALGNPTADRGFGMLEVVSNRKLVPADPGTAALASALDRARAHALKHSRMTQAAELLTARTLLDEVLGFTMTTWRRLRWYVGRHGYHGALSRALPGAIEALYQLVGIEPALRRLRGLRMRMPARAPDARRLLRCAEAFLLSRLKHTAAARRALGAVRWPRSRTADAVLGRFTRLYSALTRLGIGDIERGEYALDAIQRELRGTPLAAVVDYHRITIYAGLGLGFAPTILHRLLRAGDSAPPIVRADVLRLAAWDAWGGDRVEDARRLLAEARTLAHSYGFGRIALLCDWLDFLLDLEAAESSGDHALEALTAPALALARRSGPSVFAFYVDDVARLCFALGDAAPAALWDTIGSFVDTLDERQVSAYLWRLLLDADPEEFAGGAYRSWERMLEEGELQSAVVLAPYLALAALQLDMPAAAAHVASRSISVSEIQRGTHLSPRERREFGATMGPLRALACTALLDSGEPFRALVASDWGRARTATEWRMVQGLSPRRKARLKRAVETALRAADSDLEDAYAALERALGSTVESGADEGDAVVDAVQELPPGECLLVFSEGLDAWISHTLWRDGDDVRHEVVCEAELEAELGDLVEETCRAAASGDAPSVEAGLLELSDALAPLLVHTAGSGDGVLHVVPAGALAHVPLHGLSVGGRPLVAWRPVARYPSLAALAERSAATVDPAHALVLLDPEGNLPHARHESAWIDEVLPDATVLVDTEATEDAVARTARIDLLHAACHGRFVPDAPLLSHLVLAPGAEEDGRLTLAEVLLRSRPVPLVLLHACRTAAAVRDGADEWIAFDEAWLASGSTAVLSTCWPVDDATAGHFARRLLAAFTAGSTLAEAHREATLGLAARCSPLLWAPFQLLGCPDVRRADAGT